MAKSMTERVRDWRNKKSAVGGRSLTIMLEPETVKVLDELKEKYQESQSKLIARALETLNDSFTCKHETGPKSFTCKPSNDKSAAASNTDQGGHSSLMKIRTRLDQGTTVVSLKPEIIRAIKEMKEMGYDSSQIADLLYEAGIKTIKGHDRWEAGTIRKWWK